MENPVFKAADLKGLDSTRLNETEAELRKYIMESRMSLAPKSAKKSDDIRKAKRSLARVLTVRSEILRSKKA